MKNKNLITLLDEDIQMCIKNHDDYRLSDVISLKKALLKLKKQSHVLKYNPILGLWEKNNIYYTIKK